MAPNTGFTVLAPMLISGMLVLPIGMPPAARTRATMPGISIGHKLFARLGAERGADSGCQLIVFDRNGQAVQGAEWIGLAYSAFGLPRFFAGVVKGRRHNRIDNWIHTFNLFDA